MMKALKILLAITGCTMLLLLLSGFRPPQDEPPYPVSSISQTSAIPFDVIYFIENPIGPLLGFVGDNIYFQQPDGLSIIDVINPETPVQLNFIPDLYFEDITFSGNYGYNIEVITATTTTHLSIIDFTDPALPTQVATLDISNFKSNGDVIVYSNTLYIDNDWTAGTEAALFSIVDVSTPTNPVFIKQYTDINNSNPDKPLLLKDHYLYVQGMGLNNEVGLHILDIADPHNPEEINFYTNMVGEMFSTGWAITGDYIYSYHYDLGSPPSKNYYFRLFDVSDPTQPLFLLENVSGEVPEVIQFSENLMLRLSRGYLTNNGATTEWVNEPTLQVFDITDPTDFKHLTTYYLNGELIHNIVWHDNDLYVSGSRGTTILAVDLQDLVTNLEPTLSGVIQTAAGSPASGVKLTAHTNQETVTDVNGHYAFNFLPTGTYTITPVLAGYTFEPSTRIVTLPGQAIGQNFVIWPPTNTTSVTPDVTNTLTITNPNGLVTTIEVPAGAVSETVELSLTPQADLFNPYGRFARHAFELEARLNGQLINNFKFNQPLKVTIHYNDQDIWGITAEDELALQTWDDSTWRDVTQSCATDTTVGSTMLPELYTRDLINNVVEVSTCQASRMGLYGPTIRLFLPVIQK